MCARSVGILIGVFLLAFSGQGRAFTVEGTVKDRTGHPIQGADVYIQAKDFSKIVKTDANGHYASDVVATGDYKVTVMINGSVQASMIQAETALGRATKINFDLAPQAGPASKHKRMVWVGPEIGTHIGGGSWVPVDDTSKTASEATARNVAKIGRSTLTIDASVRNGMNCPCIGSNSGAGLAVGRTVSTYVGSPEAH